MRNLSPPIPGPNAARAGLRFGAVDAQFADGGVDSSGLLTRLPMRRKLRLMRLLLFRQLDPFRDVLGALLHRQFCAASYYVLGGTVGGDRNAFNKLTRAT
jgi:hypothetical protein